LVTVLGVLQPAAPVAGTPGMSPTSSAALCAVLAALTVLLEGCGCPEPEQPKLNRKEAIVKMVCLEAVDEMIAKVQEKTVTRLKQMCVDVIDDIENLPKGKFVVEERCEGYGAKKILTAREDAKVPLMKNCTAWAMGKIEGKKSTKLQDFLTVASECLKDFEDDHPHSVTFVKQLYEETVITAQNKTGILIDRIKEDARKAMNAHLSHIEDEEKFEAVGSVRVRGASLGATPAAPLLFAFSVLAGSAALVAMVARRAVGANGDNLDLGLSFASAQQAPE